MTDKRPEDSAGAGSASEGEPSGAKEPRRGSERAPSRSESKARANPVEASKGRGELLGDAGAKATAGSKDLLASGKDRLKSGLNSGVDKMAEGDGAAGKAARGVQAAQKAAQMAQQAVETTKNIAASAKGLIVALGNPVSWIIIAVVLVLTFITLAVITGIQVYGKNDSVDNCSATGSVSSVDVPVDASVEENRDAMMTWLTQNNFKSNGNKPLSKEQAAAIVGNFQAESNLNFKITEGNTMNGASNEEVDAWTKGGPRGLGLAQWTWNPGRASGLIELARSMKKNWYDVDVQLQMILNEMDGSYGPKLASAGFFTPGASPSELAIIFHDEYEGSADNDEMKKRRGDMAEDAFKNSKVGGYNPSGGDNCQSGSTGNGDWVNPVGLRDGVPLNYTTYYGSVHHENGALDINGIGSGGAPTDWPIVAASDGVVTTVGDYNCVPLTIWHEKDNVSTIYLHMNSQIVKVGDTVKAGQQVGGMGTKGCGSTGNHLHFMVWPDGKFGKNPTGAWMREKGVDIGKCVGEGVAECGLAGVPYEG